MSAWSDLMPTVDQDVVALLKQVPGTRRERDQGLEADLERHGIANLADAVLNTARVGVAKPDQRVYHLAAERVDVKVQRCLYIDDSLANVDAAREVGMTAVHYAHVSDLREVVQPSIPPPRIDHRGGRTAAHTAQ